MTLASRLVEYISAAFTGLWIQSHEHQDALAEIAQMCRQENWRLCVWDIERGLQVPGGANGQAIDNGGADPLAAIRSVNALATADSSALLVLVNFQRFQTRGIVPDRWGGRRPSHTGRGSAASFPLEHGRSVARSWRRAERSTPGSPPAWRP